MLFSVIVVDEQLSVLAEPPWFLSRHLDNGEDRVCLVENTIHLLKRAIGRLRIEKVDDGDDEGVNDGKDDVSLIAD